MCLNLQTHKADFRFYPVILRSFISHNEMNPTQHVKLPSHCKGHMLDLGISNGLCVDDVILIDFPNSNHNAVCFRVPLLSPDPPHLFALAP